MTSERLIDYSGGLGPARGREAPCTPSLKVRASRYGDKCICPRTRSRVCQDVEAEGVRRRLLRHLLIVIF